jgi:hypothetical protein
MSTFALVFTVAVIGFGNTFYILALNGIDYTKCNYPNEPLDVEECQPFTG